MKTCGTCQWLWPRDDRDGDAMCRRMPPQVFRIEGGNTDYISRWPIVSRASWCGEWTEKEQS